MSRVLHLHEMLAECVASNACQGIKKVKDVADSVMNEENWDLHYMVCKGLYPAHLLLRCTDQKLVGINVLSIR